jgi:nitronate monooxygenase
LEAAESFEGDVAAEGTDPDTGEKYPIRVFESRTPNKRMSGNIGAMPLWAGESVVGVRKMQPASEIVRELADEAEEYLKRWSR